MPIRRLVALAVALGAPSLAAQSLSPQEIADAIRAGETKKYSQLISDCVATAGFGATMGASMAGGIQPTGGFKVTAATSAGRIAFLAAEGKRLYKPLTVEQVGADLLQDGLYVWAEPNGPSRNGGTLSVAAPIEALVLKSKDSPDAVTQPDSFETEPVEWKNLMGGVVAGSRALAIFPSAAIASMPPGDIDFVVVTTAGERRCKIGKDDRAKLLKLVTR